MFWCLSELYYLQSGRKRADCFLICNDFLLYPLCNNKKVEQFLNLLLFLKKSPPLFKKIWVNLSEELEVCFKITHIHLLPNHNHHRYLPHMHRCLRINEIPPNRIVWRVLNIMLSAATIKKRIELSEEEQLLLRVQHQMDQDTKENYSHINWQHYQHIPRLLQE